MNLSQLKKAFEPLAEIGSLRKNIEVFGLSLTLRTLTAREDAEIQKSLALLREDEDTTTMEYLDLFRKEALSRAIIRVGDFNLDREYIETGETLADGTPVKVKKIEAVSDILDDLSRSVANELFTQLTDLTSEAEDAVSKLVPQRKDLEEEKKVLEARIAEINQAQNMEESDELAKGMTKKVSEYSEALQDMDK
tara:strand:+ start:432 stop:1013 length:582 start_codon:yes stop_codon:yes gene_type:complete